MQLDEIKQLIARVQSGTSTGEEDIALLQALNLSVDMLKLFLEEIKIDQLKAKITS